MPRWLLLPLCLGKLHFVPDRQILGYHPIRLLSLPGRPVPEHGVAVELQGLSRGLLLPGWVHVLQKVPRRLLLPLRVVRLQRMSDWEVLDWSGVGVHQLPRRPVPKLCESNQLQDLPGGLLLPGGSTHHLQLPGRLLLRDQSGDLHELPNGEVLCD
jgi:hypothetical protein